MEKMEHEDEVLFAIMHWEDRFTSIIKLSEIKHPRKPLKTYLEGEYVTALFQKKPYKARISEISDDKSYLQGKRNKSNQYPLKYCYTSDDDDDLNVEEKNKPESSSETDSDDLQVIEKRQPVVPLPDSDSRSTENIESHSKSIPATDLPKVVNEARSSSTDLAKVVSEARSSSTDLPKVVSEARSSSTDLPKVVSEARSSSSSYRKLEKRVADLEKHTKEMRRKIRALEYEAESGSLNTSAADHTEDNADKQLNDLLASVAHLSCNNDKDSNLILQRLSFIVFTQIEMVTCSRTGKKTTKSGEAPKPGLDVAKMNLLEKAVLTKCQNLTTETFRKKFDNLLKMERRKAANEKEKKNE